MSSQEINSWADAEDEFPSPEVTTNPDGTKTVVSYGLNAKGQKVKITQKIKEIKVQEKVHPLVAQRRKWSKYGQEKNTPAGPDTRTTQLGEIVELKLGTQWKELEKREEEEKVQQSSQIVSNQRIRCRLCGGEHFTSKCPFKGTLADSSKPEDATAAVSGETSSTPTKFVPRHLRKDANGNLPARDANTRDDSTTLRISQLNTFVDEDMLRNELLAGFGPFERVTVVRNRDTGESRGFAYVSFATEQLAEKALEKFNGKGYHSLILHIEWSKKKKQ